MDDSIYYANNEGSPLPKHPKDGKIYYPVLHMKLEPGDAGYDSGYRFLIEQQDKDQHYFTVRDGEHGSERFMKIHGMLAITREEMNEARRELGIN